MIPPATHRCDEFPAEYSLASCSPAELASASSATLMLQPTTPVRRANLSERQPGNSLAVSLQGVTTQTCMRINVTNRLANNPPFEGP